MMAGFGLMLLSEQDILLMCWAGPHPSTREELRDREWVEEQEGEENGIEKMKTQWQTLYWVWSDRSVEDESVGDVDALIWADYLRTVRLFLCPPSLSLFWFLSELAGWPDNHAQLHPQLCISPQQNLLFIRLIGHIWRRYFYLWVVQRGKGFRGGGAGY